MVDIKDIIQLQKSNVLNEANASLYLFEDIGTKKNPLSIYLLNSEKEIISKICSMEQSYLNEIKIILETNGIENIPVYNPDADQRIFRMEAKEVPQFEEILKLVTGEKPCKGYNKDEIREDKIRSWIIRLEMNYKGRIEQLLLFQKFQLSKMLLDKSNTIFEKNGKFHLLSENKLNINNQMDFLYYKGTFFVTNMTAFERVFGFHDYYKSSAVELIDEISENKALIRECNIIIKDKDSIKFKIENSTRLAHKMFCARKNNYYKKICFDKLIALNKNRKFNLSVDNKKKEWIIDEKTDINTVARILNDDYEISLLTDIEYLSDHKEALNK